MNRIAPTVDYSGFRRAEPRHRGGLRGPRPQAAGARRDRGRDPPTSACSRATRPRSRSARSRRACRRPAHVLGMHFFSPVHKMPLLEIVVTPETSLAAIATAVTFGRRIGKHVIVVRDGPGFYTSRALAAYMNEATWMLEEGAAVEGLDRALDGLRLPGGPGDPPRRGGHRRGGEGGQGHAPRLRRPHVAAAVDGEGAGGRPLGPQGEEGLLHLRRKEEAGGRVGLRAPARRRGAQARGGPRDPGAPRATPSSTSPCSACRRGSCARRATGTWGPIFGLGFPPFLGGPFRYLDHLGARFALETMEKLQARHGGALPARPDARRPGPGGPNVPCRQDTDPLTRPPGSREAPA